MTEVTKSAAELEATANSLREKETEELRTKIKAKFNNLVDIRETTFGFKKVPITMTMPDGTEKETGDYSKRPNIELQLPVLSFEGLVKILESDAPENEKSKTLLFDAIAEVVYTRARQIINDNPEMTAADFPYDQLSWEKIANLPKAERRGAGIPKEVWEDFGKDYIATMLPVTGKTAEMLGNAVKIYLAKFNSCKTNKPVLSKLKDQLTIYLANTQAADQFGDCVEFLTDKIDRLMSIDETALLENL